MSRIGEGEGFDSEEDEANFIKEMSAAYDVAKPLLAEFLVHLDAMPSKRIIADHFMDTRTGEMCAVAEFCLFRGATRRELKHIEIHSQREIRDNEGVEESDGWDGATVGAGMKAGLPEYVAHHLAWKNDVVWDRVETGYEPDPTDGREGCARMTYRDMTPEERWLKLRNHIAKKVGASPITGEPSSRLGADD